ncbi:MAG TPA: hypothetical protein VF669_21340 [Tepidisphaeraceae bacterium]|jgi:hypothetical protein
MKALRFLPLVYVIGVHGFVFFAPYIAFLLTAMYTLKWFKREHAAKPLPIRVPSRRFPFTIKRD